MTDSVTISKLHERVSQHDIEFAEIRGVIKSISGATNETKDAVKAIHTALDRTNQLIHNAQIKDEHFMSHISETRQRFEHVNKRIDEKDAATNKRIDPLVSDKSKIALSIILAVALGFGGMVASFYFKKPSNVTSVVVDDRND